jgi:hypothetical protein
MASAQLALSANDNKLILVNGVSAVAQNPPPDTLAIIDVKQFPPKILADIEVPASVAPIGHWSQGAAFTPDGQYILVQNMVEKDIIVLKLAGDKHEDTGQRLKVKGGPAAIRIAENPR